MAVSIIDVLKEQERQARTGDTQWAEKGRWAFRVTSPIGNRGPCGSTKDAVFPLPINPDRFDYRLPFANEVTPQQEGGAVVEDTGIVIANITMSGTTGFKLRRQQTSFRGGSTGKFTGFLADQGSIFGEEVSGQMAFWVLASKCFEGYSQLKADPETSAGSTMELHIPKETLALEVVPKDFTLTRAAGSERVTYRYNITLEVIGEAKAIDLSALEDENDIFDSVLDSIATIRDTIQSVAATIDDLTAMADQLRRTWNNFGNFLDDIGYVLTACNDFVTGVKTFVDVPKDFMIDAAELAEDATELFADTATLPLDVAQSFAALGDDMNTLIVAARDHYRSSWHDVAEQYNKWTSPRYSKVRVDPDEEDEIVNTALVAKLSGGSQTAEEVYSKTFMPGDEKRSTLAKIGSRLKSQKYTGFIEKPVAQGDTLASIAARELGDSSLWPELAMINQLQPPYITNGPKLPGTLQPNSRIIIPVDKPVRPAQVLTTGNPVIGESQADAHLGVDFELVQISKGQWGWKVNVTHGATDGTKTAGIGNLAQGLGSRLRTERGTNIIHPNLGLERLVGVNQLENPSAQIQLRLRQQILADPRIDRLVSASFSFAKDAITVDIKAQPVGATTARPISQTLT
jgi:hypothetical protein